MGYPIDVAFLDRSGRVVASYEGIGPNRRTALACQRRLRAGAAGGVARRAAVAVGDRISWEEARA